MEEYIPSLESLILTGNHLEELSDIDQLATLENLTTLSLLHNPITAKQHYRLYLIYKLPQLKLLDFRKIKMKERNEAKSLFKSKKGKEIQKEISKRAKTFTPGGNIPNAKSKGKCFKLRRQKKKFKLLYGLAGLTDQEIRKIREAISRASSLEEVERLQRLLQSGHIPGQENDAQNGN